MAGYSSRSDQLWNVAQQLVEEEIKSSPYAQQEGDNFNTNLNCKNK